VGDIVHELGHTIGFNHEHQRTDRDLFIQVLTTNIQPNAAASYSKSTRKIDVLEYDYGSIMHYETIGSLAVDPSTPIISPVPSR
jgi:hypothetical protein